MKWLRHNEPGLNRRSTTPCSRGAVTHENSTATTTCAKASSPPSRKSRPFCTSQARIECRRGPGRTRIPIRRRPYRLRGRGGRRSVRRSLCLLARFVAAAGIPIANKSDHQHLRINFMATSPWCSSCDVQEPQSATRCSAIKVIAGREAMFRYFMWRPENR